MVFITFAILIPASSRIAFAFVSDCLVCSLMPPGANSPVAGSIGSCPEVITSPLASIAWLYGPMVFINCYYTLIRCVWCVFSVRFPYFTQRYYFFYNLQISFLLFYIVFLEI